MFSTRIEMARVPCIPMALPLLAPRSSSLLPSVILALALPACSAEPAPATPAPPPAATTAVAAPPASSATATSVAPAAPAPPAASATPSATAAPTGSASAPKASPAPAAKAPTSYVVCHCCCGGDGPKKKQCLYRSKGDSIEKLIEEDKKPKPACPPNAGCTMPIEYAYCD
jgi:hypothetical protein